MRLGKMIVALAGMTAIVAVSLPTGWAAAAAEGSATAQKVQAAKTAADHEALAKEYEKEATAAKAKAAEHRSMAEAYKGMPAISGGKVGAASAMPQHCESLAKSFDQQAEMYSAMAASERELAKAAK